MKSADRQWPLWDGSTCTCIDIHPLVHKFAFLRICIIPKEFIVPNPTCYPLHPRTFLDSESAHAVATTFTSDMTGNIDLELRENRFYLGYRTSLVHSRLPSSSCLFIGWCFIVSALQITFVFSHLGPFALCCIKPILVNLGMYLTAFLDVHKWTNPY